MTPVTLTPCPHCGVPLTPSLVTSIVDPRQDETCPKAPRAKTKPVVAAVRGTTNPQPSLATLMLLGSLVS